MRDLSTFAGLAAAAALLLGGTVATQAATAMQQCGQQYQAAKAAGTLNGATWSQFRTDCTAKLKVEPAVAPSLAPATPPVATTQTANPLNPTPVATPSVASSPAPAATTPAGTAANAATPASGGRAAFVVRERQCGSEWKANKPALIAQTPGLTWPKYLSQCNARLKAAGK